MYLFVIYFRQADINWVVHVEIQHPVNSDPIHYFWRNNYQVYTMSRNYSYCSNERTGKTNMKNCSVATQYHQYWRCWTPVNVLMFLFYSKCFGWICIPSLIDFLHGNSSIWKCFWIHISQSDSTEVVHFSLPLHRMNVQGVLIGSLFSYPGNFMMSL